MTRNFVSVMLKKAKGMKRLEKIDGERNGRRKKKTHQQQRTWKTEEAIGKTLEIKLSHAVVQAR